jgi:hypothetical protein
MSALHTLRCAPSPCKGEGWGGGQLRTHDPHPALRADLPLSGGGKKKGLEG